MGRVAPIVIVHVRHETIQRDRQSIVGFQIRIDMIHIEKTGSLLRLYSLWETDKFLRDLKMLWFGLPKVWILKILYNIQNSPVK